GLRRAAGAVGLRELRRDPAHEIGRRGDVAQLVADARQEARLERVLRRAHGAALEVLAHELGLVRGELAVHVVVQAAEQLLAGEAMGPAHDSLSDAARAATIPASCAISHNAFCSIRRPRWSRERTVPTGQSSISAISW